MVRLIEMRMSNVAQRQFTDDDSRMIETPIDTKFRIVRQMRYNASTDEFNWLSMRIHVAPERCACFSFRSP
jgi:hypothetical protein